jgi:predicted nucleic acid-binding protein
MPLRVYIDTSVLGGCIDEEFAEESRSLIEMARFGKLILLVSDLLLDELSRAPSEVQSLFTTLPAASTELLETSEESLQLRDAYLAANVVGPSAESDAQHVAIATLAKADVIVSWNFKHIVHVDKIRLFNAVNLAHGYRLIDIRSPLEVV